MKTAELCSYALDYATAIAEGWQVEVLRRGDFAVYRTSQPELKSRFSIQASADSIIERNSICTIAHWDKDLGRFTWTAWVPRKYPDRLDRLFAGPTRRMAAMRAWVGYWEGDEISIPAELV